MKTCIHSVMCPKIEADFLEDWILHHLNFGISHMFIYNTGDRIMFDSKPKWIFENGEYKVIQEKRSYLNKKENFKSKWEKVISKYKENVSEEIVPIPEIINKNVHVEFQTKLNFSELKKYSNLGFDWVFNIDGDEFIDGNLSLLENSPENVSRYLIGQYCYEDRHDEFGNMRPMKECKKLSTELIKICNKNIVRPKDVTSWKNVHYEVELAPGKSRAWTDEIFFHHYRGHGYKEVALGKPL